MEKLRVDMVVDEDQELLNKMKEAYLGCPAAIKYINELGIPQEKINDNITKIYDMVSDINYCRRCPGVNNCRKNNPTLCSKVVYSNGVVDRQLVPCQKFIDRIAFEKQYVVRDFDESWLDVNLKDLDHSKPRDMALAKFVDFVKLQKNDWIYLIGGPNSGRSYLAAALATDAARRHLGPICFLNCSQRIRELSDLNIKEKETFQKKLDMYCNCKVLILDDFGNEYKTDFIRDAIIFQIINYRATKKLFTIVTSDFCVDDIITLYSTSKPGEVRAKQIGTLIKSVAGKEINLGELSIY